MTAHNIFETISSQYFQLTNSEKKVADYVLRHRIDVQYMSISELAEECTVADATISRFCRRLGLTGYNAFKLELAKASMTRDSHRADAAILQESSGFHAMCKKLLGENVAVLEQTIQLLDPRQVSRPSRKQWTYTFSSPCSLAIFTRANRWVMWLWTPPSDSRPIRCRAEPHSRQLAMASR